ncbi:hypothetical protein PEp14_00045 [Erwinia phage PEp14]|uniref:Uncharacterized protein n=1 Tax=Erwinia phage PEp14 TaxID=1131315 RepID=H2DE75_9CAUD|nr:hypothetical protein PEp14_00045 [Erwinia phage PEp14]AEY69634.1 hypothetical protein PEp14_00045 [Erwinia phage PEp14]
MSLLMTAAVVGAVATVAFNFFPLGKPTHSGTRHGRHEPPAKWTEEASFWLTVLNPVRIVGDVIHGYTTFSTAIGRLLVLSFLLVSLWTAGFVIWAASNAA